MSTQAAPQRARRTPLPKSEQPLMTLADVVAPPAPAPAPPIARPHQPAPEIPFDDPELAALLASGRDRRPFGLQSQKMVTPKRPGWHRHWFNDVPGRVKAAKEAGYDHVLDEEGKPTSMVVGTKEGGGDLTAYLMQIPEQWFQEDQRPVQEHIDAIEASMRRGVHGPGADDNRYLPRQIKIGSRVQHG